MKSMPKGKIVKFSFMQQKKRKMKKQKTIFIQSYKTWKVETRNSFKVSFLEKGANSGLYLVDFALLKQNFHINDLIDTWNVSFLSSARVWVPASLQMSVWSPS